MDAMVGRTVKFTRQEYVKVKDLHEEDSAVEARNYRTRNFHRSVHTEAVRSAGWREVTDRSCKGAKERIKQTELGGWNKVSKVVRHRQLIYSRTPNPT